MGARRRPLLALVAVVLAVWTAGAVVPTATADGSGLVVVIDSPAAGATVAGTAVPITVTVTSDPSVTVASVSVEFANVSTSASVGQSCASGCTRTLTVDTTGPGATQWPAASSYADGPQVIMATASSYSGDRVSTERTVKLDNQRPTETLAPPPVNPGPGVDSYTATDRFHLEVFGRARPGGSVTGMQFRHWVNGVAVTSDLAAPVAAGGPWTLDLDSSSWRSESLRGDLRAIDDRGVVSTGTTVRYFVDHGFTVATTSPTPVTMRDFDLTGVQLGYDYGWSTFDQAWNSRQTFPVTLDTYLDGALIARRSLLTWTPDPPGTISVGRSDLRVDAGDHVLRYVVTDNRDVSSSTTINTSVTSTLAMSLTAGPVFTVLPGRGVSVGVSAESSQTTVAALDFFVDGKLVDSWRCQDSPCPTHVDTDGVADAAHGFEPGSHVVVVRGETTDPGGELVRTATFDVLPYARASAAPPASFAFGQPTSLVASVVAAGSPAAGARVMLQRSPALAHEWTTAATAVADADGRAGLRFVPTRDTEYRLVTADRADHWGAFAGEPFVVPNRWSLLISSRPSAVRRGHQVVVRGVSMPAGGAPVLLVAKREGRAGSRVALAHPRADGTFTTRFRPGSRGTWLLRIRRDESYGALQASTSWWSLRVR